MATLVHEDQRSALMKLLGWALLIFSGLGLFLSIIQNVIINVTIPVKEIENLLKMDSNFSNGFPKFLFYNFQLFFLSIGAILSLTLISAIGLTKRKEWARKLLIGLLCLGLFYLVGITVFQWFTLNSLIGLWGNSPKNFLFIFNIMKIFSLIMVLGFGILFCWLIIKFASEKVKAEFLS